MGLWTLVDTAEDLRLRRAKLYSVLIYANVQPHSGYKLTPQFYLALFETENMTPGMSLAPRCHLTHGARSVHPAKSNFCALGISSDSGEIDYDEVERLAKRTSA